MNTLESIYEEYQKKRMDAFFWETHIWTFATSKNSEPYDEIYLQEYLEAHHEFSVNDFMCKLIEKELL